MRVYIYEALSVIISSVILGFGIGFLFYNNNNNNNNNNKYFNIILLKVCLLQWH